MPDSGTIKNFLVTSGVLKQGGCSDQPKLFVSMALRLKVRSLVWVNSRSLFGYHSISASGTTKKMTKHFCNILGAWHINCLQEMRVLLSLYTILELYKIAIFVGNKMVEGQQFYMVQHNSCIGK